MSQEYMNHLKSFEGFRSSLAKVGMIGALSLSPTKASSSSVVDLKHPLEHTVESDEISNLKGQISDLSRIRKGGCKDSILNSLLEEIEMSVESGGSEKYQDLFNRLSEHLYQKYQFKVEEKDMSTLDTNDIKNMSLILLLGWLSSLCLSICGAPQAWQSFKSKNSFGISWGFLLLWGFGELFGLVYVLDRKDTPLIMNYAANILIVGIIFYFKVNPKKE